MALPHRRDIDDHAHEHERHTPVLTSETATWRESFGVAQIVCLITGILFVVLGAIGLARSGLGSMVEPTADIGGMSATPLLSLIHLFIGLAALIGATGRGASRGTCLFIGPVLIAGGIIALVEEIDAFGYTDMNGIVYLLVGAIALVSAMLTPAVAVEDRRVTTL